MKCLTHEELEQELKRLLTHGPYDIGADEDMLRSIRHDGQISLFFKECAGRKSVVNAMRLVISEFKDHGLYGIGYFPAGILVHFKIGLGIELSEVAEAMGMLEDICQDDADMSFCTTETGKVSRDYAGISVFVNEHHVEKVRCANQPDFKPSGK